ncbi:MAG: ATP-binding cassette domain-containing protein [Acidimicrobiales bacterium]
MSHRSSPDAAPDEGSGAAVGRGDVRVEELRRHYGSTVALDGVSLDLEAGVTGLLGPNGAGKTTLLSILATVASPDSGRLSVLGFDPEHGAERVEIRRRLGYLPQELGYHRHFRVAELLDYVAILKEILDRRQRRSEVARVLAATDLEAVAKRRLRSLSGGMRRRVGIAQALLGAPELLVLDEPTAGLDPEQRLRFRELLSDLPGRPVVVLSTHQADDVAAICQTVVVLLAGRVRFAGTPPELARLAEGRVWSAGDRDPRAEVAWRAGDGRWRHIGDNPPPTAELVAPTVEDGYLRLAGTAAAGAGGDRTDPGDVANIRRSRGRK